MESDNAKRPSSQQIGSPVGDKVAQELENLRKQLDTIDQKIVSLLAKRQAEVEHVVKLKKTHNLPVYHPAREENLISHLRNQGAEAGLDSDYIEELYRRILRQSRVEQTARLSKKGVRAGATVLIVGGMGSMGQYFSQWFGDSGYRVRILDRNDWVNVGRLCRGIELAIISVPIEVTAEVAGKLGPHLPVDCVLAGRNLPSCRWLIDQFSAWGTIILQVNAREHDEIMSIVQTVRHFATFAFGQFLYHKQIDLPRTIEFSSPIYRLELGMVGRLFAQDPSLYSEIIFASPKRLALLKDYLSSLANNLAMVEKGDKEMFSAEFKKIAAWFGPFSEQAMRESTYLIDKLIERF
ncbi:MAG: prephenate dehydrogenase/arogenate dehydrogenase family protein [Deltaproteobacteria bacterium]|nr:prephenate dehydrogenase/arogenate dehydrogenase family protein [Deltaproteobacteria bacterium]